MHYDDSIIMVIVIAAFWLMGLALCIGVPIGIVKLFHIKVSLWTVSLISIVAWIAATYIFFTRPI